MKLFSVVLAVMLAASGISMALTTQEKDCIKVCCENAGGVYGYEHNSCENASGDGALQCSDACREVKPGPCPGTAILLLGFSGAVSAYSCIRRN